MRTTLCIIALLLTLLVRAQNADLVLAQVAWDPLPDTLFQSWKLDTDQVRRLAMIEEDYDAERARVMSDAALSNSVRDATLDQLATGRRQEVRGVLQADQYRDWMSRTQQ